MSKIHPTLTVIYTIEEAIKSYRKFAQKNISKLIADITVDQVLILIIIDDNILITQKEIGDTLFKDYASITRMIDLLVTNDYIKRSINEKDRRRSLLSLTPKGKQALKKLTPTVLTNREIALSELDICDIQLLRGILKKIVSNCEVTDI